MTLGSGAGLDTSEVRQALEDGAFADAIANDLNEAKSIGVTGVPFFFAVDGRRPRAEEGVNRPVPLDTSFLVALDRETASGEIGPARRLLPSLRGRQLVVSIVSVEELLEGAADAAAASSSLQRFSIQGLHLAQARRCALLQRRAARRMMSDPFRMAYVDGNAGRTRSVTTPFLYNLGTNADPVNPKNATSP